MTNFKLFLKHALQQKTPLLRGVLYSLAGVTREPDLSFIKILSYFTSFVIPQIEAVDATGNDPARPNAQVWSAHHAPRPTTLVSLTANSYTKRSMSKLIF